MNLSKREVMGVFKYGRCNKCKSEGRKDEIISVFVMVGHRHTGKTEEFRHRVKKEEKL